MLESVSKHGRRSYRHRSPFSDNLDLELEKYMRKYFPKEAREKQRSNDMERGLEDYGPNYKPVECLVM